MTQAEQAKPKPYARMKDSGVPWLGEVPEHWEVKRGKSLFEKLNRPIEEDAETVTCFRDGTVTLRKNRRLRGFTEALKEIGYQGVKRGDLVIHAMDAFAGAVGVSDSDGKATPVYAVCAPRGDALPNYYAFTVREMARNEWILALSRGIRERSTDFRFETFGAQFLPFPPPDEQAAIVRYLNHADQRIRKLIAAKQRMIRLLQEQKQVIIHQAVTRGLDPDVRLKPSGVEWLGDVPEGWEVISNRSVLRQRKILVGKKSNDYKLLSLTLQGVIPRNLESAKGKFPAEFDTYQVVKEGQIVFCLFDVDETPRTVGLSHLSGMITGAYDVFEIREIDPKYLYFWYLNIDHVKGLRPFYSGLRKVVPRDTFMALKLPVPPADEQQAIVQHIETETAKLDQAIARAEQEITLLREYRTRLIADVVTGKLDVREAAAGLPELEQEGLAEEAVDGELEDAAELEEGGLADEE